jgi:pimeloyl-ACP methyl ester carboxylesterase
MWTGGLRAVSKRQFSFYIGGLILVAASCAISVNVPVPPPDAAFYLYQGLKIHFEDIGKGRPVLFLHGFGSSLETWRFVQAPLEKDYRLVLLES